MTADARLLQTRAAFDALAAEYDEAENRNELLMRLRYRVWDELTRLFPAGSRLLDLGCGTGIDAAYLAQRGRFVLATDLSRAMVERTRQRARQAGVASLVATRQVAIEDIRSLQADGGRAGRTVSETLASQARQSVCDGIYSNRGAFNCVSHLEAAARDCSQLLPPGGRVVATVIGRWCPWELLYFGVRRQWGRTFRRGTTRRGSSTGRFRPTLSWSATALLAFCCHPLTWSVSTGDRDVWGAPQGGWTTRSAVCQASEIWGICF